MYELPPVINVAQVRARYGIRDAAAARKLMRTAGAFVVAGRLVVRVDDLDAFEQSQADAARRLNRADTRPHGHRRREPQRQRNVFEPLPRGWWRSADEKKAA